MTGARTPQPKTFVTVAVLDGDRVLLVQEEKLDCRGLWNLPGGHLHDDESVVAGARRELLEETGLATPPRHVVGIYTLPRSIRFVFGAAHDGTATAFAGDEIMDVRWATLEEVLELPDHEVTSPRVLRAIIRDLQAGTCHPLEVLVEQGWSLQDQAS